MTPLGTLDLSLPKKPDPSLLGRLPTNHCSRQQAYSSRFSHLVRILGQTSSENEDKLIILDNFRSLPEMEITKNKNP
jgi:hypothetical protein